jgi:hypothetical protein
MSFFKSLFKAVVVGTLVFMTGGAAAAYFAGNAIVWSTLALQGAALSGISSVVGYLSRPKTDRQAANDRLNISVNASAEGKFVFGETASGTDVVYNEKIGDDKVFYVVAAAWHEIESFGSLHFNDELITLDGTGTSTGDWAGVVKVIYKTGTLTQDAISVAGSTWPLAAKGAGVAHFGMFFDVGAEKGQEKLSGGIPSRITQTIKGAKVYDPRLDSSIGGTGSHRVNDQSTWEFENGGKQLGSNWALVVAHYLLGYRQNGKLIYGVGVDAADIDWQQVADMADVCDTLVDSKPKYKVGGIIPITNDHEAVIKQFEDAIDGKVAKSGGKYYIYAPHNDTADVKMVITDDDIIAESGVNYSPTAGLQSLFNTATGQYISPENLYQFAPYPEVVETAALEDDGKARIVAYDFSMIQEATLAQRISRERIRRSRFTASMSLALGPKYIALKPFDVVQINIKETDNQPELFRIIRIVGSVNGYAEVEFIEEDASIYDVSAPLGTPLTQLDPASYNPAQVITPVNVQATNVIVQGDTSAKDAIRVTWNNPGAFVEDSEIRYRVTGSDDDYAYARTTSLNSAIISPVEPLTEYDIQVRHITRELVLSDYVEITHTSGDETLNIIRQPQIDEAVPNTPFAEETNQKLSVLDELLGGVDALIEEVSQDIAIEYERLENTKEIRQVRIDNLAKTEALVNEYLEELSGETLPELNARLEVAEAEIDTLENVTLPALDSRLDSAESQLEVVIDTTIPQVQSELDIAQGQIATIQSEVFAATASVPQTIDDVLEEISQDTAEIFQEIYASRIGANAVTALAIKANAVTADKIVANAITADKIAANAITADKIQANAIDGRTITGLTINGAVINAGTLNAIDIVGTSTISGASIIGNSISGGTISGAAMTAGSITSAAISAGSIVGTSIEGAFIGGTEIIGGDISGTNITGSTITGGFIFGTDIEGVDITGTSRIFSPEIIGGEISGTNITATNTITGATINGVTINTGTLNGGSINIGSGAFTVNNLGALTATNATITGSVTGSTITGGSINIGGGTFQVDSGGNLTATSVTITGDVTSSNISSSSFNNGLVGGSTVRGGTIETIGGTHMLVTSATPFGSDNLIQWYGLTSGNLSGGAPIYANLTRTNAIRWIDSAGEYSRDIVSRRQATTTASATVTHPSQNSPIVVRGRSAIDINYNFELPYQPPDTAIVTIAYRITKAGGTVAVSRTLSQSVIIQSEPLGDGTYIVDLELYVPIELEFEETIGYNSRSYVFEITSITNTASLSLSPVYSTSIVTTEIRQ